MIIARYRVTDGHITTAEAVTVMTAHLRTAFAAIGRIADAHPDFFEGDGHHPDQGE